MGQGGDGRVLVRLSGMNWIGLERLANVGNGKHRLGAVGYGYQVGSG